MMSETLTNPVTEFAKWAIRESAFAGSDLDGGAVQEKAVELGLLVETAYDPDTHGPSDIGEPGMPWFVFAPPMSETHSTNAADLVSATAVLQIIRDQPYFPDTQTGTRQQWVKDMIASKVATLASSPAHATGAMREADEAWWPTNWPNRGSVPDIVWQGWLGRAALSSPAQEGEAAPVRTDADGVREAIAALRDIYEHSIWARLAHGQCERFRSAIDTIAALKPEGETGPTVAVKPLEWHDRGPFPAVEPGHGFGPAWSQAYPTLGARIDIYSANGGKTFLGGGMTGAQFETLDEAKAAAQADYDRRIRAALTVSPSPSERDRPLMTVHEFVEGYEFRNDDGGGYTPTEAERAMLEDAIEGWRAETADDKPDDDLTAVYMAGYHRGKEARSERDQHQGDTREAVAKAIFAKCQHVYRRDHDHFPLRNDWGNLPDDIRQGWFDIADAAIAASTPEPLPVADKREGEDVQDAALTSETSR